MRKIDVKTKNGKLKTIVFLLVILLILVFGYLGYIYFKPYYQIQDRVNSIESFKGIDDEKPLGWLRVQGTNIDFPILYYYDLNDVSDSTYELGWTYTNDKTIAQKTTIFSHNVLNVSNKPLIADSNHKRFEQLLSFVYTDFVKNNKYIQYTIDGKNYLYKIYAISFQEEANLDFKNSSFSKDDLNKYIDSAKKNSYFDFDIDVNEDDKLITLVTCTRFFGDTTKYSFVVDARLVRDSESIRNYKLKETNKYQSIKKILEGDVNDENI